MKSSSIISAIVAAVLILLSSCGKDAPKLPSFFTIDTFGVTLCTPVNTQHGVNPDDAIMVAFNNNANTLDVEQHFTVTQNGSRIEGQFSWMTPNVVKFIPRYQLKVAQRYVITIPRTVRDRRGNSMSRDFISEFYVGSDFTRPGVLSSMPVYVPGGAIIDPDNPADPNHDAMTAVTIRFSKPMDRLKTQAAFSIAPDLSGYFDDTVGEDQLRYVFTTQPQYGTQYKVTIGATAQDLTGNTLSRDFMLLFSIGIDMTPPEITGIGNGVTTWLTEGINEGVEKNLSMIVVDFSKAMDRSSTESAFSLIPSASGYFSWSTDNQHMTYMLTAPLSPDAMYTVSVDTAARDSHGLRNQTPYQVVIRTNGANSQRVTVDDVDGRNAPAAAWTNLLPEQTGWPTPIDLAGGSTYTFRVHFATGGSPVVMNRLSLFGNCLVENSISSRPPSLVNIVWEDDSTAVISVNALFTATLYRLTIVGGTNGIKDVNGNPMAADYVVDFRQ